MTTRITPVSVAVLAVCVWLIPAPALAQTSFGALSGRVTDEQGGFLPGAGHINPEAGYGSWPEVEAWCVEGDRPIMA